jgi:hypothetical protein
MATWGGSTVDNLENITEDEDAQDVPARQEEEDDGKAIRSQFHNYQVLQVYKFIWNPLAHGGFKNKDITNK